ncbi:MAG: hypothetical protein E6J02_04305 [Chloroflexi bacterium]|nr:MAG: hypothetical protein E6J02_04305 [Chloroflexota bacterium]
MKSHHQLHGTSNPPLASSPPRVGLAPPARPLLVALGALLVIAGGVGAWGYRLMATLPGPGQEIAPARSIIVYDRAGRVIGEHQANGRYQLLLKLSDMGRPGPAATLAAEDRDFYKHGAVDFPAVVRALAVDAASGQAVEGGSTITQQLVKIELLTPEKSASRKVQELFLAYQLESRYSKNQILEMYLNRVYYGHGAYGLGSAAKTYFGANKNAADLTQAQAAFLAGLLKAPSYYDPFLHFDRAKGRELYVLNGMVSTGALTRAEAQKAAQEDIRSELQLDLSYRRSLAPHFVDYVVGELERTLGAATVQQGGLAVYTTLDANLQALAERSVADGVQRLSGSGVNNGDLLAAKSDTGEILAWVGSSDYSNAGIGGQYDVILSPRQPGSSFKPYVYEAALRDHKITVDSPVHDVPTDFGGYRPVDFDNRYLGTICAKQALVRSRNIPAVEVARLEGMQNVVSLAQAMGIKSKLQPELQTAIGGGELTMADHVQGYQVFANDGVRMPIRGVAKVADRNGNTVYQAAASAGVRVLAPQDAYLMTWMLKDYQSAWGFGWNRQMASKTGTTGAGLGSTRDAWIMAYNPNIVVGAWVGNTGADGKGGTVNTYGEYVATTVMAEFVNGLPSTMRSWYQAPAGLTAAKKGGDPLLSGTENLPSCSGAGSAGGARGKGSGDGSGGGEGGD